MSLTPPTPRFVVVIATFALALLCVSVPRAHAEGVPFENAPDDLALRMLVVVATPVVVVGDVAYAVQGSWVPPVWAVPEILLGMLWLPIAVSNEEPSFGPWPVVCSVGLFAHGVASLALYDETDTYTGPQSGRPPARSPSPSRKRTPRRWGMAPSLGRDNVMLHAVGAF